MVYYFFLKENTDTSREENKDLVCYTLFKIHFDIVHMQAALIAHVNFTA